MNRRMKVAEAGRAGTRRLRQLLRRSEASQLMEFALVLPILVVLLVGAVDFGNAYNLKQKLTNAAREGARIAISQSTADLSQPVPNTVQAVRNAVVAYLSGENLDTSFIGTSPTKTAVREWTYYSSQSGSPVLMIDRSYPVPVTSGGTTTLAISTRVRLRYPFTWSFSRVVELMVICPEGTPGCYQRTVQISTEAIMKNLT